MNKIVKTTTTTTTTTVTTTTESRHQGLIRPFAIRFSMIQPLAGRGLMLRNYVAPNGVITVSLRRTDKSAARYYGRVGAVSDALALDNPIDFTRPPPANHFQLLRVGPADFFQAQNIPVNGIPADAPSVNNQKINVGAYAANGALLEAEPTSFIAVPQRSTVSVPSKGCLFFAYTPDGTALPHAPGEKFPDNRPAVAAVPIDSAHVLISVPVDGAGQHQQWTHSGGHGGVAVVVTADGQVGDADDTDAIYHTNSALQSQNIAPLDKSIDPASSWEGLLAGMWDFGAANGTQVMSIGTGLGDGTGSLLLEIPQSSATVLQNLILGSHQESNWGAAVGSLNVSLVWS